MGFLGDLAGAALNGLKEFGEEEQEYYREAMRLSKSQFREEYQRAMRSTIMAEKLGYRKAAKERGFIR